MRRKIVITLALTLILSAQAVTAFADELELTEVTEEQADNTLSEVSDDETEGKVVTELTEEYTYDPSGKEEEPVIADIGEIMAIDKPETARFELEFKPALDRLLANFPKTLTVHCGDDIYEIEVKWVCDGDYSKSLGEYLFVPELSDYTLAEDIEIPAIIAVFEKEDYVGPTGLLPEPEPEFDFEEDEGPAYDNFDLSADTCTPDGDAPDNLPSYYNLYEQRKLPAIRKQKGGTCWAHAVIGAMEADLIHDGKATTDIDLSEMHLAYYCFNTHEDPKHCYSEMVTPYQGYLDAGGTEAMGVKTLMNLVGAVLEEDVPMSDDPTSFTPDKTYVTSKDVAQIRNAYIVSSDRNDIKKNIIEHGGVMVNYNVFYQDYDSLNNSYYNPNNAGLGHGVVIVGWDDSFSRDKFLYQPEGDGAWLIRNSWGDNGYGHYGYFWMSYYDTSLRIAGSVDADTELFNNCYTYAGMVSNASTEFNPGDKISVQYDISADEKIMGIGLYGEFKAGQALNIVLKNKGTGQCVKKKYTVSTNSTFNTIYLDNPFEIYDGSKIEIVISCSTDKTECLNIQSQLPATSERNLWSVDGGYYINGDKCNDEDLCIMLYTNNCTLEPVTCTKVTGLSLNKSEITLDEEATTSLETIITPADATYKDVTWVSSDPTVATVSDDGVITAVKVGTAYITAEAGNSQKATCKVNVKYAPPKPGDITVNYIDTVDNSIIQTLKVAKGTNGAAITEPTPPTHAGYEFWAWSDYISNYTEINSDIDIYAHYLKTGYTVWFYDGYTETPIKEQVVDKGGAATAPPAPKRKGYKFIGWDRDFTYITQDTFIFAEWEQISDDPNTPDPVEPNKPDPVDPVNPNNPDTPTPVTPVPQKTNIKNAKITLDKSSFTYNGKVKQGHIKKVILGNKTLKAGVDYTEKWPAATTKSKNVGTYSFQIEGKGKYTGEVSVSYTIKKAANKLKISSKKSSYKTSYSKLKKKNQVLKASTIYKVSKKGQGTVTYTLSSAKKNGKKFSKYFTVDKRTGKITIKKGLKKGSYKVTVKVKAGGNKNYKAGSKNVVFTVNVK